MDRAVFLVMRSLFLGRRFAATVYHLGRLRCMDQSEGIHHHDIPHLVNYGSAAELGPVLTSSPDHVSLCPLASTSTLTPISNQPVNKDRKIIFSGGRWLY